MENLEIEEIRNRISSLLSDDEPYKSTQENGTTVPSQDPLHLIKEQYLEIELGLQQVKNGQVYDAIEALNSLK